MGTRPAFHNFNASDIIICIIVCHTHVHNVHTDIDTTAVSPVHINLADIVSIVIVELFVIMESYLESLLA